MILKLEGVRDAGLLQKERLVLRATQDGNIGDHIVLCAWTFSDGRPLSGAPRAAFWMPDEAINVNDLLVLYTKAGESKSKQRDSGRATHFHYWHQDHPLWDGAKAAVVVGTSAYEWISLNRPADEEEPEADVDQATG